MDIKNIFKVKRYMGRINFWITTAILLFVTFFSVIIIYNVERIVLKNEYETNKRILYQVKYNIDFMDDTIKNLCKYLYVDNDVVSIMYDKNLGGGLSDIIIKMDKLGSSIISTNPFVHSIYIYNNLNKTFYSSNYNLFYNDRVLKEIMKPGNSIPRLKPVSRKIESPYDDKHNNNVFTYFMYETLDKDKQMDGAVIVNVKSEWLFENIRTVNTVNPSKSDKIFILDDKGVVISDEEVDPKYLSSERRVLLLPIESSKILKLPSLTTRQF